MDFQDRDTEEQERFRKEVSAWLDANVPRHATRPSPPNGDPARREWARQLRSKLGDKGWLLPTCPVEWGGLGLTSADATVIQEELRKRDQVLPIGDGAPLLLRALLLWGSEEQKRKHLPEMVAGKVTIARLHMEPGSELDLDNLRIHAFRERDDFVLEGEGFFAARGAAPDYLWTLAVTAPQAPPQRSVGMFLIPAPWPGIQVEKTRDLADDDILRVGLDEVRVPASALIGGETEGWVAAVATLLAEDDAADSHLLDRVVEHLFQYAGEARRDGLPLSQDPFLQPLLTEAHIIREIGRLFKMRNDWMTGAGQELTYHEAQLRLWVKRSTLRLSEIVRDVMGPYALLDHRDSRSPLHGEFELHQRQSLAAQNFGAAGEVQAAMMAKSLGLEATERREAAAETVKVGALSGYEAISSKQQGG